MFLCVFVVRFAPAPAWAMLEQMTTWTSGGKKMKTERLTWVMTAIALMAAAIVLMAALIGCRAQGQGSAGLGSLVKGTLSKGSAGEAWVASGTIQADEIRVASELGGRIERVAVAVGQSVRAGDMLATLDDTALSSRLGEAEASVATARANLALVRAGPRAEEIAAAQAALDLAMAQRDGAQATWQNALADLRNPQELDVQIADAQTQIKLAEQAVAQAQAELAKQRLIRDQKQKGTAERDAADWQVKAAEEQVAAAQGDLQTAQTLLKGLQSIRSKPLGLIAQANAARGKYQAAEAAVAIAQARLDDLVAGPMREAIAVAEQSVRLEQAKADAIRVQVTRLTLTSPVDGMVLDQALHPGELAAPAATILSVADLSHLTLVVYVPANRVGQVRLGQDVQIRVDSFPDKAFPGQVSRIGDEPEFTPRNTATQSERQNTFYAVEIKLSNQEGLLKPGMPADATF